MCGIGGAILPNREFGALASCLIKMKARLKHRGPDDEGTFYDSASHLGFVHSRLSILDLSSAGHQPMVTDDGRYIIVFNGEIYNFQELRRSLEVCGITFRSHSDTEVILRLFQREGKSCVSKLEGMFAFAVWDTVERSCFLARDPLGVKPLYVWEHDGNMAFASEMRAVLEADLGPRRLSRNALQGYLLYGSVQEPDTLVEGITCLPAGSWMEWRDGCSRVGTYWQLSSQQSVLNGDSATTINDETFGRLPIKRSDAIASTRSALIDSVRKHHVSDVPVNLFLSGGVDSTALLGLSKTCGFDNLRTFSISFDDDEFNEGHLAERTAKHFKTNHHDWRMTDSDGCELICEFLKSMDQPSNDGFNTYCVSKFAHDQGAKVVLSGLGGDELFGGYPSFQRVPRIQSIYRWASIAGGLSRNLAAGALLRSRSIRKNRLGAYLESEGGIAGAYWAMRGFFLPNEVRELLTRYLGEQPKEKTIAGFGDVGIQNGLHSVDAVQFLETTRYMRNQLLRDSDVMSMVFGLELRVPFVDRRLCDAIAPIPSSIRLSKGKKLLLDAVSEIPDWIRSQPKRGFRFPFDRWITESWGDVLEHLDVECPVKLNTWYRRWSLFTLENFIKVNRIVT